jgi:hypothetical protein
MRLLTAGLLLNLAPIRWLDPHGSFSENLQAWPMVLIAMVTCGLAKLPRAAIAVLVVAMAAEFVAADLQLIR